MLDGSGVNREVPAPFWERLGVKFPLPTHSRLTPSMKMSRDLLKLSELILVHPGAGTFPLDTNTRAMGLREALAELRS